MNGIPVKAMGSTHIATKSDIGIRLITNSKGWWRLPQSSIGKSKDLIRIIKKNLFACFPFLKNYLFIIIFSLLQWEWKMEIEDLLNFYTCFSGHLPQIVL